MKKLTASARRAAARSFVDRELRKYTCHHGSWNAARIMEAAIKILKGEINAIKQREREERNSNKRRRVSKVAKVPRVLVQDDVGSSDSGHGVKNGKSLYRTCPP